jgi:hypothetical protein
MTRTLAELDRMDAIAGRPSRRRRGDLGRQLTAGVLAVALVATIGGAVA